MKFFGKSVYTRFIEVLAIMVIMVILMGAYRIVLDSGSRKTASQKELELKNELFAKFEDGYATLNKFTIYGKNMNLGGFLETTDTSYDYTVAIYSLDGSAVEYKLKTKLDTENNRLNYTLSENINEGIDLDDIPEGEYYIYIKGTKDVVVDEQAQEITKYYSLNNVTNYSDTEYYTTTIDGKNNKEII